MNSKKFFWLVTFVLVTAIAIINTNIIPQRNGDLKVTLSNIEASATWLEGVGNWFIGVGEWYDSKVYKCELRTCKFSMFGITDYDGYTMTCVGGSEYAHCWDCSQGCDAFPFIQF